MPPTDILPKSQAQDLLLEFLSYPLKDAEPLLARFAQLPNARYIRSENRSQRFVYIPGSRKDRVLLVAHADTAWDRNFPWTQDEPELLVDGDSVCSASAQKGIGADDRGGCALLWLLRHSGHSLLLLDGEEQGALSAKYLRDCHPALHRELNRHGYIMELDLMGQGYCHYHQVPVTRRFTRYIEERFQVKPLPRKLNCDIPSLCRRACGVNLSIGVYAMHSNREQLSLPQWYGTYERLSAVLAQKQPSFPTRITYRLRFGIGRLLRSLGFRKAPQRKA